MKNDALLFYKELQNKADEALKKEKFFENIQIQVGSATCENAAGAEMVGDEFLKHIKASRRDDIKLRRVGCTGRCSLEPIVSIFKPKEKLVTYQKVTRDAAHEIFMSHILDGKIVDKYLLLPFINKNKQKTEAQQLLASHPLTHHFFDIYGDIPFYAEQSRIALKNSGLIDPENIYEYVNHLGFQALATALDKNDPNWVIDEITKSNLRGRGGAGFPTGKKWGFAVKNLEKERYIICNADEGDPGAFMDRSMLESDPFSVVEGLMIAGFAIGAKRGFFYIRAEYPLAVKRVLKAIEICRTHGLLGKNILLSGYDFDIEVKLGAGAFVCGEETALIHSIEGERGQPRIRPPFPAERGLWGKPTIINNVETLANVPVVITLGSDNFSHIGTKKSGGTKAFAITGKVNHTGLVEVPMGTSLKEIIYDICGGVPNNKQLKAIQTGGPAGGCIPASLIDTKVDYDNLQALGSIMGSGGMIVLDEDDCMVNFAKFFITFSQSESCGKCVPCREGTMRMLEILERITGGSGTYEDLENLRRLALLVQKASLCGLGRAAPNPVLSTLQYFYDEYEAHVKDKTCRAKQCSALLCYEIDDKKCVGCTMCARNCPVGAISGERKKTHKIDQTLCVKCGKCLEVCRFGAVKRS
jgi:NADH:ubiquinone oxidoreductase subunit F (NADH-binding)/(2Fe-2S) ferredoxin/NAD-dependent dihydropyrimidine dehydrogenase PreA subunit